MQDIAREFNFSETTLVLPAEHGNTCRVRIFTPAREIPFAGHPNVGTAFTLAGEIELDGQRTKILFEEKAGLVAIEIHQREGGVLWCELAAPQAVSLGGKVTAGDAAAAVSLQPEDFVIAYEPQEAPVGLPFLMAEVRDRATLRRAQVNLDGMEALIGQGVTPDVHLFPRADDGFDRRVRMFAPLDGVPEDPATGSANCALAGMLALRHADVDDKGAG